MINAKEPVRNLEIPKYCGQLVWCMSDPSLGLGLVVGAEHAQVRVRFFRTQEERLYTTRSHECFVVRYFITPGDQVKHVDGRTLRVKQRQVDNADHLASYTMTDGSLVLENLLLPEVKDVGAKERLASLNLAPIETVRTRLAGLHLSSITKRAGVAAIMGARVLWLPHQIDVALRALEQDPVRLLLADEVGLGKTVEAALIYAALREEGRAKRVLILTPEYLAIQWLGEIYRKTHELLVLLDDERLKDAARDFPGLSPFAVHQRIVMSLDKLVRDPVLLAQVQAETWDLVIVDEAHHLRASKLGKSSALARGVKKAAAAFAATAKPTFANLAYELVEVLARQSRHLLLLTATPMALDPAEYHALLRLLSKERFDELRDFTAVTEKAATLRRLAEALLATQASGEPLTSEMVAELMLVLQDDPGDLEELNKFTALSETPAFKDSAELRVEKVAELLAALRYRHGLTDYVVRNRRGPVGGLPERQAKIFPLTPTPAQALLIDVGEAVIIELVNTIQEESTRYKILGELLRALWATPQILLELLRPYSPALCEALLPHVEAILKAPLDVAGLPTGDARLRWLLTVIRELAPAEKLLIFVESAAAVKTLREVLELLLGTKVAVFHRDLAARDQDRQVAWFRDAAGPKVMLSTEAGGEGRNFQFCHKVVLYDLPWRPATVEQRIGRVDRVGQTQNVEVLVPYFNVGPEAAVLKIMHEAIGVLDKTVGGIDYALEYVSDKLAALLLNGEKSAAWKELYLLTAQQVQEARTRIESGADPLVDYASFVPGRVQEILGAVPENLEALMEAFITGYANHTKLRLQPRGGSLWSVDGAVSAALRPSLPVTMVAAGSSTEAGEGAVGGLATLDGSHERSSGSSYVATFSRIYALDHEDVEFLSFGHPLVEQALEWAKHSTEASAALGICRGFKTDGAIMLWSYIIDLPGNVAELTTYFSEQIFTLAVDEAGKAVPEFDQLLLTGKKALERMDALPLKQNIKRWRMLVEQTYQAAESLATTHLQKVLGRARWRLEQHLALKERDLRRAQARALYAVSKKSKAKQALLSQHAEALTALAGENARLLNALESVQARLLAAVAVRLLRVKQVSA